MNVSDYSSYLNKSMESMNSYEIDFDFAGLFSIIIILAVIIFVAVIVYTFMKSMRNPSGEENIQSENLNIQNVCKYCGEKIDSDSKFCKNCGQKIE